MQIINRKFLLAYAVNLYNGKFHELEQRAKICVSRKWYILLLFCLLLVVDKQLVILFKVFFEQNGEQ